MYIIYVNNTLPLATDLYMKLTLNWAAYGLRGLLDFYIQISCFVPLKIAVTIAMFMR